MTRVSLDDQPLAVREFFQHLPGGADGVVVELGGRPVVRVIPVPPWTAEQDRRRCALIDRKEACGLTTAEEAELAALQDAMQRFIGVVAPLPLEDARRLHRELLEKAVRAGTNS